MSAGSHPPAFDNVQISGSASPDGLLDVTVMSRALNRRADVTLFAPKGVDDQATLPLVLLLHGVYGSHFAWARNGSAHHTLQSLVDGGHVRPMVLAMPSDGLFGVGSGYVAGHHGDAESWVVDEVPAVARLRYPGAADAGVAIVGLSMGGWGALRLAARRPGVFSAAVGMSPLTRWEQVAGYAPPEQREEHRFSIDHPELALLLAERHGSLPPLRVTCGSDDALLGDVRALRASLAATGIVHEYEESPGGHEWPVWTRELRSSLMFVERCLQERSRGE